MPKQYTIPIDQAVDKYKVGLTPNRQPGKASADQAWLQRRMQIRQELSRKSKPCPIIFADYETRGLYIAEERSRIFWNAHGGFVIRSGKTGIESENSNIMEYSLKLESNPEFTASVLVAYARAAWRLNQEGQSGAKTVFDIPPAYLSPKSGAELRSELL